MSFSNSVRDEEERLAEKPGLSPELKSVILAYLNYKLGQAGKARDKYRLAHKTNPEYKFDSGYLYWKNVCSAIKWLAAGIGREVDNGETEGI